MFAIPLLVVIAASASAQRSDAAYNQFAYVQVIGQVAPRITDSQVEFFMLGIETRNPVRLQNLFGERINPSPTALVRQTGAEGLLEGLEGCSRLRFREDDLSWELHVEWICPNRAWDGSEGEVAGYVTRLWTSPLGLAVDHGPAGVRANRPPPVVIIPTRNRD